MKKRYLDWLMKRRIKQTIKILRRVDKLMVAMNMPHWKRKQIWRDFIKSQTGRNVIINFLNGTTT